MTPSAAWASPMVLSETLKHFESLLVDFDASETLLSRHPLNHVLVHVRKSPMEVCDLFVEPLDPRPGMGQGYARLRITPGFGCGYHGCFSRLEPTGHIFGFCFQFGQSHLGSV